MYRKITGHLKHRIHHILAVVILGMGISGAVYSVNAYPEVFNISAELETETEIIPEQEIIIKFSEPMLANQVAKNISITPEAEAIFSWRDGNKTLGISPADSWEPEKEYKIAIAGAKSIMLTELNISLDFQTITYPKVAEFYPSPGEQDVILDIEDPMTAVFNKSIEEFRVKFIIRPYEDLAYQLDPEKKKVDLLLEKGFQRGQQYEVKISVRHKTESDEDYREIFTTSFKTKPLPPTTVSEDLNLRIENAKRFAEAKIKEGKYIDINVKSQVMTIFEDGKLLDAFLISSGKAGMPTPQGTFKVYNKFPRAWSKKYGLYMPYWMAIAPSGQFGIHELPEWPGGYKEGAAHLGIPVSHGCVRLGIGPAERVYNWAELGTPVVAHD